MLTSAYKGFLVIASSDSDASGTPSLTSTRRKKGSVMARFKTKKEAVHYSKASRKTGVGCSVRFVPMQQGALAL